MRTSFNAKAGLAALAILTFSPTAQAHTWIESIRRIASNGSFVGPIGYQRGFIARGPGVNADDGMVYRLTGQSVPDSAPMCKDSQKSGTQGKFPKLQAAPKDFIALQYLENGHVTKVLDPRPFGNGTVYVYGTKQPSDSFTFNGIHKKWNADGTGGDKKGKLLATRLYDDGQCYQVNPAEPISVERFTKSGVKTEVPCQTDLQLPEDAGTSGDYTLYWVWDYALMDKSGAQVTLEFYTACMDISMTSKSTPDAGAFAVDSNILNRAIPAHLKSEFLADPTSKNSLTAQPFDAPKAGDGGSKPTTSASPQSSELSQSAEPTQSSKPGKSSTANDPAQGPITVTVTQPPITTVYVTRDPTSKASSAAASSPTSSVQNQRPKPASSSSSSTPTGNIVKESSSGGVFISGGPTSVVSVPTGTAPPSTLITSVQASGRPSVAPFTRNSANGAAQSDASPTAKPAGKYRRWSA
jgi:hypothetical protein